MLDNDLLVWKPTSNHEEYVSPATETYLCMDIARWQALESNWLCLDAKKMEDMCSCSENITRSWLWIRSSTTVYEDKTQVEDCVKSASSDKVQHAQDTCELHNQSGK